MRTVKPRRGCHFGESQYRVSEKLDQSKVEASTCSRREVRENSRQLAIIVLVSF